MESLKLFKRLDNGNLTAYLERYVPEYLDTLLDPYEPDKTGLPMTVYISQQQQHRPACLEVSQHYPKSNKMCHSSQATFSVMIPRLSSENSRIVGDTGEIKLQDMLKVEKFIQINSKLLLGVWDMTSEDIVDEYYYYWDHIIKLGKEERSYSSSTVTSCNSLMSS